MIQIELTRISDLTMLLIVSCFVNENRRVKFVQCCVYDFPSSIYNRNKVNIFSSTVRKWEGSDDDENSETRSTYNTWKWKYLDYLRFIKRSSSSFRSQSVKIYLFQLIFLDIFYDFEFPQFFRLNFPLRSHLQLTRIN